MSVAPVRSGACRGDDHPRLHRLCPGMFNACPGDVVHSRQEPCGCPCHKEGTDLHRQVHGAPAAA